MGSRIRFRDAQGREGLIELANDPVYVGRAPDCAIRSDDAMVSRRHSRIKREGSAFFIEDLDSSNGTMVNNSRVQKHQLRNDDAVICGSLTLLYMEDAFQQPPPTMMAPAMRPQMPPPPAAASIPAMPSMTDIEIQRLKDSIESLRLEVDEARAAKEKEVAEGMRLRAEHLRFHQRLEDQQQMIHDSTEAVEEHKRIIEDMKPEVEKAHAERDKAAMEAAEAREQVASANRQLQRVQEEATKVKADLERHKKMITELTAAKEDGYKKLNEQLAEVDQVRRSSSIRSCSRTGASASSTSRRASRSCAPRATSGRARRRRPRPSATSWPRRTSGSRASCKTRADRYLDLRGRGAGRAPGAARPSS